MTSRSSEIRVKVTWDLKFQKWWFSNSVSSTIFQPIKKIPTVSDTRPKYLKSWAGFLNFLLAIESHDFKLCQKIDRNFFLSDLNETCCDVRGRWDIHNDMTFKVIWGQVKVRRWPQFLSGLSTLCVVFCVFVVSEHRDFIFANWLIIVSPSLWMTEHP